MTICRGCAVIVGVVGLVLGAWDGIPRTFAANELRCGTLGSACIASEPLNTNSYVAGSSPGYLNPGDTTGADKQATNEGVSLGAALIDGGLTSGLTQHTPVNSGEAWTKLPPGHSLSWILKQNDQSSGNSLSHKFATTDPTARRSLRFYRYYSIVHSFSDDTGNGCNSGKLIQMGNNGTFTSGPLISMPGANMYDVNSTQPGGFTLNIQPDCCMFGPGGVGTPTSTAAMKGRWWRFEFAFNNAAPGGPPTYFEGWMKDVTTPGTSEIQFMDSRVPMTSVGPTANFWWQSPMTDNLHVTSQMRDFAINMFRSNNGAVCTGHLAHTHALWAAWPTSAGQRIGAAVEIEQVGPPPLVPPGVPTGVTVTQNTGAEALATAGLPDVRAMDAVWAGLVLLLAWLPRRLRKKRVPVVPIGSTWFDTFGASLRESKLERLERRRRARG